MKDEEARYINEILKKGFTGDIQVNENINISRGHSRSALPTKSPVAPPPPPEQKKKE